MIRPEHQPELSHGIKLIGIYILYLHEDLTFDMYYQDKQRERKGIIHWNQYILMIELSV